MKLIWLDLETSGLNPQKHSILEVAFATSELESPFDIWESGLSSMVLHHDLHLSRSVDDVVRKMHTENGLWEECRASNSNVEDAQEALLKVVPVVDGWDDRPRLAGDVHFDLGFILEDMPLLAKRLHYAVYDVSVVKFFCRSLGMPKLPKGEERHRAGGDVLRSIEDAKACAEWLSKWRLSKWRRETGSSGSSGPGLARGPR